MSMKIILPVLRKKKNDLDCFLAWLFKKNEFFLNITRLNIMNCKNESNFEKSVSYM